MTHSQACSHTHGFLGDTTGLALGNSSSAESVMRWGSLYPKSHKHHLCLALEHSMIFAQRKSYPHKQSPHPHLPTPGPTNPPPVAGFSCSGYFPPQGMCDLLCLGSEHHVLEVPPHCPKHKVPTTQRQ